MDDPALQKEANALIALANSLVRSRAGMDAAASDAREAIETAIRRREALDVERGFDAAVRDLRAAWLRVAAAETAAVFRSPTEKESRRLARSHDSYGYERDFQPAQLEARCDAFFGAQPAGWTAAHLLCSSGQATLATILLTVGAGHAQRLRVFHAGGYFETRELVDRCFVQSESRDEAHCVVAEPVACDGRFSRRDVAAVARRLQPSQTLIVDETLSAPATALPAILAAAPDGVVVIHFVSALKLFQQGLELANVGILSVCAQRAGRATELAAALARTRTLIGSGLRFVDALALETPFFLDRVATDSYAQQIFAHNATLARAVAERNVRFAPIASASQEAGTPTPYCTFELAAGGGADALEELAHVIERESESRGLHVERGGSFGFRGHRFEVIEPESGEAPFLRVALGARGGGSCLGLIRLMSDIAARDA